MQHVSTKLDEVAWRLDQSDTVVQQQMPLTPEIFHGRETLVQDITQLLIKEESSRVCILGPGGMGKTSVSLAVVESTRIKAHFFPEHLFWVPCIEATSANLFLELLYTQLQIPRTKQITLSRSSPNSMPPHNPASSYLITSRHYGTRQAERRSKSATSSES